MDRLHRRFPLSLRVILPLLPLAASNALAPPLQAQTPTRASPTVVRSVPPESRPNPALEAALREVLFPVRIDDGQGHGPDPGSAEGEMVKRNKIKAECERMRAPRYAWSRVDLNGDGRPEVVAQVLGTLFCGTGGCPLLIFREPSPGRLQLITRMSLFKDPLIVTERRHNRWKELITRVRVDAGTGYYAELRYDGRSYPTNPSVAPAIPLRRPEPGTAYLAWNDKDPRAHALPCEGAPQNRGL
ncbi:hypothetical protein [Synechococcus sp. 1G10]|uniref:hypothetical protein n=1 Tax=Synechococcus sp. 1G10 TaxID=2025605 RepID=UPI00117D7DDA|nr:hypothetical protein [Synechococcus sp. 1G10]